MKKMNDCDTSLFLMAFTFLFSISYSCLSLGLQAPKLLAGQCLSDPESKTYLKSVKNSNASVSKRMIEEIGVEKFQSLQDTPQQNYYFCQVECAENNGNHVKLWITQSDSPSQFANMNGFLCHSISIEDVVIVGSIKSPRPVASPFYAFDTEYEELHSWLKRTGFVLSPEQQAEKWSVFTKIILSISTSYFSANSVVFIQAGGTLWEVAHQSEVGQQIVADRVQHYIDSKWKMAVDYQNPEYLVFDAFKNFGRFLEYQSSKH